MRISDWSSDVCSSDLLFDLFPVLNIVLKVVSVAYLLWLAWKIANAAAPDTAGGARGKPMSFFQAVMFQWVNPKAWSMALTAIALYAPDRNFAAVPLVAVLFGIIHLPSTPDRKSVVEGKRVAGRF